MSANKAVVYKGPYTIKVEDIGYPEMKVKGKSVNHGVILQILATNICGSDLHMYRGRTDIEPQTPLGHEITGMVIEKGHDVEQLEIGDIVSVPFNVACGRCRNCKGQDTHICLTTNDLKPGAAYGFAEMGPWQGGQAEYIFVPYADFNLLKFPDREMAREKLIELTMLSDIFPTGFHGAITAGVGVGATVYIAGAGPVGLCAAISSYLLGAACVIIGDTNNDRLEHAQNTLGCETINLTEHEVIRDQIAEILRVPEVDCAIDAIGYEAHGHGHKSNREVPSDALDTIVSVTRSGGHLGVPGVYLSLDPKSASLTGKIGRPAFEFGRAWDKGLSIATGQTPVMRYNRQLMTAILFDRVKLSRILNTTPISFEQAEEAYSQFEQGVAQKFVFDPQGLLRQQVPHRREAALTGYQAE
ncbi:alcohol dehydrogenase catalytic domain-containing protein [Vampirovibrio sp.]|uniref:alcohol dehydrogenase catalytic domain-containing protein n=1 Tax=Vampirovibrio sp. TaxID=2717857 RepID=UPI00359422DB